LIEGYPLLERRSVSLNTQFSTDPDVKAALDGLIGFLPHLLAGCQIVVDSVMESFLRLLYALPLEHDQIVDRFDLAEENLVIRFKVDRSDIALVLHYVLHDNPSLFFLNQVVALLVLDVSEQQVIANGIRKFQLLLLSVEDLTNNQRERSCSL